MCVHSIRTIRVRGVESSVTIWNNPHNRLFSNTASCGSVTRSWAYLHSPVPRASKPTSTRARWRDATGRNPKHGPSPLLHNQASPSIPARHMQAKPRNSCWPGDPQTIASSKISQHGATTVSPLSALPAPVAWILEPTYSRTLMRGGGDLLVPVSPKETAQSSHGDCGRANPHSQNRA